MLNLNYTFLKMEATDAIKEYTANRLDKLAKYITYPCDVHVTLSVNKTTHKAEITCHAEHQDLNATAQSQNLYESIDASTHKLEKQLKKEREKRKGHNNAHTISRPAASRRAAQDLGLDYPHREKKAR